MHKLMNLQKLIGKVFSSASNSQNLFVLHSGILSSQRKRRRDLLFYHIDGGKISSKIKCLVSYYKSTIKRTVIAVIYKDNNLHKINDNSMSQLIFSLEL